MNSNLALALADKARAAASLEQLGFVLCNDTHGLLPYRQAALVQLDALGRVRLFSHSGLAAIEADSPYALWLADVVSELRPALQQLPAEARLMSVSPASLSADLAAQWEQWLPVHVWALPLIGPDGALRGVLLLARDEPWPEEIAPDSDVFWLLATARVYGHAWWALAARGVRWPERLRQLGRSRGLRWALVVGLLLLLVPVREYALAPAEVVSLASQAITAPQEGVIRRMLVQPNTLVKAGEVLAELDDTTLHNRVAVAQAALATARADYLQSSRRSFDRIEAKADLGMAEGRVREREAELRSLRQELARLQVQAPADGVFVYSNPDDWVGKPVQTGERMGFLADPKQLGLLAWVPVAEAINLQAGSPMTLFLRVAPLSPLSARLDYASYQVSESPDGVASYRVRGTLAAGDEAGVARVGLRGTVRMSGDWTVLGYLLLRRPWAAAREWCGC